MVPATTRIRTSHHWATPPGAIIITIVVVRGSEDFYFYWDGKERFYQLTRKYDQTLQTTGLRYTCPNWSEEMGVFLSTTRSLIQTKQHCPISTR